jgi:hypothetical protein
MKPKYFAQNTFETITPHRVSETPGDRKAQTGALSGLRPVNPQRESAHVVTTAFFKNLFEIFPAMEALAPPKRKSAG